MEAGVSHAGQEDSEGGEEGCVRVRQPWSRRLLGECTKRSGSAVDWPTNTSPCEALRCVLSIACLPAAWREGDAVNGKWH